ncbi:MAG: radical SAM protein, partial [Gammaproteobacteria bacterium]|nr:radical SAM protein [Gammaproteobacteria bacterium]
MSSTLVESTLRITEIFYSIQGEASTSGLPTVFVRLTGCPLRCTYCDTEYAFHGGEKMQIAQIVEKINAFNCPLVCITGGEPLAQPNVNTLMDVLC